MLKGKQKQANKVMRKQYASNNTIFFGHKKKLHAEKYSFHFV
jgi:hypothetical protein